MKGRSQQINEDGFVEGRKRRREEGMLMESRRKRKAGEGVIGEVKKRKDEGEGVIGEGKRRKEEGEGVMGEGKRRREEGEGVMGEGVTGEGKRRREEGVGKRRREEGEGVMGEGVTGEGKRRREEGVGKRRREEGEGVMGEGVTGEGKRRRDEGEGKRRREEGEGVMGEGKRKKEEGEGVTGERRRKEEGEGRRRREDGGDVIEEDQQKDRGGSGEDLQQSREPALAESSDEELKPCPDAGAWPELLPGSPPLSHGSQGAEPLTVQTRALEGAGPPKRVPALRRFSRGALLLQVGVSPSLAGPELFLAASDVASQQLHAQKTVLSESVLKDPFAGPSLGSASASLVQRELQRSSLLTDLGPCRRVLTASADFALRRRLLRKEVRGPAGCCHCWLGLYHSCRSSYPALQCTLCPACQPRLGLGALQHRCGPLPRPGQDTLGEIGFAGGAFQSGKPACLSVTSHAEAR